MRESDIAFRGVAGQAELLRRGEISARELAEISLERIDRLDPELNAFAAVYHERALAAADAADRRRGEGDSHALLGIPVAVKDEIDIAGEVTSTGTGAASTPARADAEVVRRLRAAGAVIVGKTTMPELGLWPFTESLHWGVTRNPWDTRRTPGGSSGGSAAAVAAGLVPAALAADGAGSIRIPAACCGLFGLKPQHGRVPMAPHDQANPRWVVFGALTRSVLDSALVLDAIGGPLPGDRAALSAPPPSFAAAARAQPPRLRVAVSDDLPPGTPGGLSPEVRGALSRTADDLRRLGHEVSERDIGISVADTAVIVALLFRGIHAHVADVERPERLERRTRAMGRPGVLVAGPLRDRLRSIERRIAERMRAVFADIDVLVTPTVSRPPPPAQAMEGHGATTTYLWSAGWVPFNVLWNSTGQPAASVPAGFTADGLPLAVQLVARDHEETTLLSLAGQLEASRKWTEARPPLGAAERAPAAGDR